MPTRIALAYSGGLDTSAIIPWLTEQYGCEVIAVAGDVGQGSSELDGIEDKAKASGAKDCYVVDLTQSFIEEFAFPTLLSGAIYERRYLLGTAIARPVLAKAQVDIALQVGADALAHGCTGKGNDQVRFESTYAALAPDLQIIAPWREWSMRSRGDLLEYLANRGVPTSASAEKIYSRDANLWHTSHEGGDLEDPWNPPPDDIWLMTTSPHEAPDDSLHVTIGFDEGRPRTLNGESLSGPELVHELNIVAGAHGVGRVDLVENRLVGMKSRGCYESPGATVLAEALQSLIELTLDRPTARHREQLAGQFAELVYNGQWFTPLCATLRGAVDSIGQSITGEAVVELYKGSARTVQRRSPNSLYDQTYATFDEDEVYNQSHAEGFIRLFSLPNRIAAQRSTKVGAP